MKTLFLIFISHLTFAQVDIANFYQVDREGLIYRGKEPKQKIQQLQSIGIETVIIFKNEVKNEVATELTQLNKLGLEAHHIPFRWKEFASYTTACEQVVSALNILMQNKELKKPTYFHCTAGEDRTGLLAGLYLMLEENQTLEQVFKNEMCAKGYADGSHFKPRVVTAPIYRDLSPLFIALAEKIATKEWYWGNIDPQSCEGLTVIPTKLRCKK
jgi:protein-tyrosine phosphatase